MRASQTAPRPDKKRHCNYPKRILQLFFRFILILLFQLKQPLFYADFGVTGHIFKGKRND
jgi:hypothetical protein